MDSVQLSIFHTNDMHGRAEAMARLRSFVRRRKAELEAEGQTVLFFDAGDALDRRFPECALSKGAALAPVLNAMGYDLMTMGNDILLTYGPRAMADLVQRLAFPTLAANCRDGDLPPAAGLQEAVSLDLPGGLRLGVLGLTAPWNGAYEAFGYHFPDSMETARRLVERLRAEGTSAIIVLSHLGLADDLRMAEEVPGIQAIIGAHSHDVLQNGLVHAGVLIAQAGAFAERVGLVRLTLDTVGGLRSATAEVVPVSEAEPQDPDVLAALAEATREVQALAARPVAILLAPLDVKYEAECDLGNLLADALRERMEAQAALVMGAHLNGALPSGTVTFGQVAEVSSSTANPQRTPVRGSQILSALEIGLDSSWTGRRLGSFRGAPNGRPQISGMEVAFDSARPVGRRVVSVRIGGAPLQADGAYLVAHTDAETMSGVNLLRLEPGQSTESEVPTVMREVVEDYLRGHSPVPTPPRGRWTDVGDS